MLKNHSKSQNNTSKISGKINQKIVIKTIQKYAKMTHKNYIYFRLAKTFLQSSLHSLIWG